MRPQSWRLALPVGAVVIAALPAAAPPPPRPVAADHGEKMAASRELFAAGVRRALADHCLKCHGGDKTRGGLDLASRETLLHGGDGGAVVVPGKADQSKLYRLAARLDEPHMPPAGNRPLTAKQLADLRRWIDLGAAYDRPLVDRPGSAKKPLVVTADDRRFWSFRPLARPAVPDRHPGWERNPIDRFVTAKLADRRLTPTPEADRRKLIRRLSFDLTGLPPTPDEVAAFLADARPGAYERLVDRLLADPAHGERWARHWLDVARFAESHGFEHDYDRPHAWPYRDFVVRALNADLPYDTFVRWQIAGDEFAPGDALARTATGFLGAGVHSTQITANTVEKERYDELDDIVRTTGTAMLGLTVGCARCHDHKYDPIPTSDYYRLVATFTKTVRSDVDLEPDPAAAAAARRRHATEVESRRRAIQAYESRELPARLRAWLASRPQAAPSAWATVEPTTAKSAGGATFTKLPDGSLLAGGPNARFDTYTFVVHTRLTGARALRLEALAHPSLPRGGPGRAANGNFALSDIQITITPPGGKPTPVKVARARATFEQRGLPVAAAIDGDARSAWAVDPQFGTGHAAAFDFDRPVGAGGTTVLTVRLRFNNNAGHNIGRPRLSLSTEASPPAAAGDGVPEDVRQILSRLNGEPDAGEQAALLRWYRGIDPGWRRRNDELERLRAKGPATQTFKAMVCGEGLKPLRLHSQGADYLEHTHYLERGDPSQKKGVAAPGFLQVLSRGPETRWREAPPKGATTPYLRRSLANWMTDVEAGAGHLLARVIVNRLWQHHFGRGLVATPSDFGLQGERPSHPELLDWLAAELVESGWSLKHVHRLIVTSAAYRQGTTFDRGKAALDPENRLLWRRTPRRLEAEVIRDALLAVGGQLDRRMFGPGTLDPTMRRRSLYFFVKRSRLIPMLVLFDAPDGTVGIEQRTTTTIAPQALLLMNNPVVRQSARAFADRLSEMPPADAVRRGYALAVGRPPTPGELAEAVAFLKGQADVYREEGKPDAAARARADLCQVLLGLNEFVYVD